MMMKVQDVWKCLAISMLLLVEYTTPFSAVHQPQQNMFMRQASSSHHAALHTSTSFGNGSMSSSSLKKTSLTSQHAVAVTAEADGSPSSLRSRVRSALSKGLKRKRQRASMEVRSLEEVAELQQFSLQLGRQASSSASESISPHKTTVVFFHAPFCKACQAAIPLFHKLARSVSRRSSLDIDFVSIRVTHANKQWLHDELGVSRFPFGYIWQEGRLMDQLPMLRKSVPYFEAQLKKRIAAVDVL